MKAHDLGHGNPGKPVSLLHSQDTRNLKKAIYVSDLLDTDIIITSTTCKRRPHQISLQNQA